MSSICYKWGNANITFAKADWPWNDCQQVTDCVRWGTAGTTWANAGWLWSECGAAPTGPCAVWSTTPFMWKDAAWWWIQCGNVGPQPPTESVYQFVQPPGVDATTLIQPWLIEPWNPYRSGSMAKRKKLIKLICKVNGKIFEQEKESEERTVSVDDISMEIGSFNPIGLDIRLE